MKGSGFTVSALLAPSDTRLLQAHELLLQHSPHAAILFEVFPPTKILGGDPEGTMAFNARETSSVLANLVWPATDEARATLKAAAPGIASAIIRVLGDPDAPNYANYDPGMNSKLL
jgi:hypothetical protein